MISSPVNFVIGSAVMLTTGVLTMLIVKTLRNFYRDPEYASARMFLDDSSTQALKFAVMSLVLYGTIAFVAGIGIYLDIIPQSSIFKRELPSILAVFVIGASTNFFRVISSITAKDS